MCVMEGEKYKDQSSLQSLLQLDRNSRSIFYSSRPPLLLQPYSLEVMAFLSTERFMKSLTDSSRSLQNSFSVLSLESSSRLRWWSLPIVLRSGLALRMSKLSMIFYNFLRYFFQYDSCALSCLIYDSIQNRLSFIFRSFFAFLASSFSWQQLFSFSYFIFIWHCYKRDAIFSESPSPLPNFRVQLNFYTLLKVSFWCCYGASVSSYRQLFKLSRKHYFFSEAIIAVLPLREPLRVLSGIVLFFGVETCCMKLSGGCLDLLNVSLSSLGFQTTCLSLLSSSMPAQDFLREWKYQAFVFSSVYFSCLLTSSLMQFCWLGANCVTIWLKRVPVEFRLCFLCSS